MTLPKTSRGHHPSPVMLALASLALVLAGCDKAETPAAKVRANAPLQAPKADASVNTPQYDANEALKERLARQEAAAKLFDKSRPEPAPAPPAPAPVAAAPERRAEPARVAAAPAIVPVSATAAAPAPAKLEPPKPEPVKAPEPAPVAAKAPEPVKLAAAQPSTAIPGIAPARLVSRVDPEFPREAIQAGANRGSVKARMTLDGNGNVTRVEVVEANPRRVFDRAVVRSLSQWRFSDGPSGRTVETEVEFKLSN